MNDFEESPVDLGPLRAEAQARAGRIADRVMKRIAEAPATVPAQLARLALPGLFAAAACLAAVLLTRPREPDPDRFAVLILGPGPARAWISLNREPDLSEVMTMLGGVP